MTTKQISETHLERKQVGIVRYWCECADTLCELVEVVLCIVIRKDKAGKGAGCTLFLPEGPTESHMCAARASRGSEPTIGW